jgi:hypothetical protein
MAIIQAGYTATLQPTTPDTAGGVIEIRSATVETLGQAVDFVDIPANIYSPSVWAYVTQSQENTYRAVIRDAIDGSYLAHTDTVTVTANGWIELPVIGGSISTQATAVFLYTQTQASQPWFITRHNSGSGDGNKHQDANADTIFADPAGTAISGWVTTANDFSIYVEYSDTAPSGITSIGGDNVVKAGETAVPTVAAGLASSPSSPTATLGGESLVISNWNSGQPILDIPLDLDVAHDTNLTLSLFDGTTTLTLDNVQVAVADGWEFVAFDGTIPNTTTTESFYEYIISELGITPVATDRFEFTSSTGLTVDTELQFEVSPPADASGNLKIYHAGSWTLGDYVITDAGLPASFGITHDAAMAHGTDFVVTVSNPAVTPTDANSTLSTGAVSLVPVVTGSAPTFTLTYSISRLDLQEGSYTWTQTVGAETANTSSLAYTIDGNGTSEYYGTVAALTGAWAEPEYSALATGDNIYAVRTAGTGAPDVTVGAFPESTTWTIYIQDQADDTWGAAGTLTVPAAASFLPIFARFNNQLIGGM